MSELHDKARSFAAYLAKGLGLTESSYVIRDLLAENERLLTDLQQANVTTLKAINQRMDAEARLRALCEQKPCAYQWLESGNLRKHVPPYASATAWRALIPRPSMEDFKTRCDLCGYQHGHKIGCDKNPLEIALRSLGPSMESYK